MAAMIQLLKNMEERMKQRLGQRLAAAGVGTAPPVGDIQLPPATVQPGQQSKPPKGPRKRIKLNKVPKCYRFLYQG